MKREHRIIIRHYRKCHREPVREALERAALNADVPVEEFIDWAFSKMALKFKEERMDQRIMIENEIRSLGIRFPNGTVNKAYDYKFTMPIDKISGIRLEGGEDYGVALSQDEEGNYHLKGKPFKAGDTKLKLKYFTLDSEPESELEIPVAFNPNPRDLWRNIPCSPDLPYPKPDTAIEYVKVETTENGGPRKDIVAASVRGRSHAQEGKARDDHFSLHYDKNSEWYVMAVADGAGSAKYSRKGSEVACKTIIEHSKRLLSDNSEFEESLQSWAMDRDNEEKRTKVTRYVIDIIFKGAIKAHEAVRKVAEMHPGSILKDYATTLMFAICKKYEFGWFVASFWVGDGAMAIYDEKTETVKLLGSPDEGEFSGQTRFLTMPEIFHDKDVISKRVRMTIVPDFTALFLMTDGISDPMFETDKNLNDYSKWKEFYNKLSVGFPEDEIGGVELTDDNEGSQNQLLKWLEFWSPGNHDDRTIAILY